MLGIELMDFLLEKVSGDWVGLLEDQHDIAMLGEGTKGLIKILTEDQVRTVLQNSSLHKYCDLVAVAFNDAGLDMRQVLRKDIFLSWTMERVKEFIWRQVQIAVTEKKSSTKLTTTEIQKVYLEVSRHLSSRFGINVNWPSRR